MKTFRVWIAPSDYEYSDCVDGLDNGRWLLAKLAGSFVFRRAQPIDHNERSSLCTFHVFRTSMLPFATFQKVLNAVPEVTLLRIVAAK